MDILDIDKSVNDLKLLVGQLMDRLDAIETRLQQTRLQGNIQIDLGLHGPAK